MQEQKNRSVGFRWMVSGLAAGCLRCSRPAYCVAVGVAVLGIVGAGWLLSGSSATAESQTNLPESRGDLDQDPDIEPLIRNALRYAEEQRFQDAAMVMQQVLDKAFERRSLLIPSANGTFVPIRTELERQIRENASLLSAYRIMVDGEARGLLAQAAASADPEPLLREIQSRFFFSRSGDRAAFELACLHLDRHEFVAARRLLERVLTHPDLSVPRPEVYRRLAAVSAFLGDKNTLETTRQRLSGLQAAFPGPLDQQLTTIVERAGQHDSSSYRVGQRLMAFGDASRRGRLEGLVGTPGSSAVWTTIWQTSATLTGLPAPYWTLPNARANIPTVTRPEMVRRWREGRWLPTSQAFFDQDTLFVRTHHFLNPYRRNASPIPATLAFDLETGELKWASDEPAGANIRGQNLFPFITSAAAMARMTAPAAMEEQLLFSDSATASLSVINGVVYSIEGRAWTVGLRLPNVGFGNVAAQVSGNRLAAIDARTGKVLWRLIGDEDAGPDNVRRTFQSPPVGFGGLIYVLAEINDGLYLLAIDPSPSIDNRDPESRILWQRYLAAANVNPAAPSATIGMALDGSDLYIATGRGVVLAVSAIDGDIHWAGYYDRASETLDANQRRIMMMQGRELPTTGFSEDTIVSLGDLLVVLPSDAQRVLVFDRLDGRLLHQHNEDQHSYLIGAVENGVILGGSGGVVRYEVTRDRLRRAWRQGVSEKFGRGALASDGVYVPSGQKVVRLQTSNGRPNREIPVAFSGADSAFNAPLGNIFPAGDRLLVSILGQWHMVVDAGSQLASLTRRIEEAGGRDAALFERRAAIHRVMDEPALAAADFREAAGLMRRGNRRNEVEAHLFDLLMQMADADVAGSAGLVAEAEPLARTEEQRARLFIAQAALAVATGDRDRAVTVYFRLAMDRSGQTIEVADGEQRRKVAASLHATRALGRFIAADAQSKQQVMDLVEQYMARAVSERDIETLVGLTRLVPDTEVGRKAAEQAASMLVRNNQIEQAEVVLRQALARSPSQAVWFHLALAEIYEEAGWAEKSREQWQILLEQFGDVLIPESTSRRWMDRFEDGVVLLSIAEVSADDEQADDSLADDGRASSEPEVAMQSLRDRASAAVERLEKLTSRRTELRHENDFQEVWFERMSGPAVFDPGRRDSSDQLERLVIFASLAGNQRDLIIRTIDGPERWVLRFPQGSAGHRSMGTRWVGLAGHSLSDSQGEMFRDGHIGIAAGGSTLMAFGLVNQGLPNGGNITPIWQIDLEGEWVNHIPNHQGSRNDASLIGVDSLAVGNGSVGLLVSDRITAETALRVVDSRTGSLRWETAFVGKDPIGVGQAGDSFFVLMGNHEVEVFDADTGVRTGGYRIAARAARSPMLWHKSGLYYVASNNRAQRINLETGRLEWAVNVQPNSQMRLTEHGVLLVWSQAQQNAEMTAVDIETGKRIRVIQSRNAPGIQRGIFEADMNARGELVLFGRNQRFHLTTLFWPDPDDDTPLELDGGRGLNVFSGTGLFTRSLLSATDLIPVAVATDNNNTRFDVRIVHRQNARDTGRRMPGPNNGQFTHVMFTYAIEDNVIVVAQDGIRMFRAVEP